MHGRCGGENHGIHEGHEKVLMQQGLGMMDLS